MDQGIDSHKTSAPSNEARPPGLIGDYIVSASLCREGDILKAVARQNTLKNKGEELEIGKVMIEMGLISPHDLSEVLRQQNLDRFASSELFHYLDRNTLTEIYNSSQITPFTNNDVVFHQGDPSQFVAVVLQGTVSLHHKQKDNREVDIQVLRKGESFGEMGLLANHPRLMTARCIEPSELLIIPGELFIQAYQNHPEFSQAAIKKWFSNIIAGKSASTLYQDSYYKELLSQKETLPCVQILGQTKKAKKLRDLVKKYTDSGHHLLLTGDPGTMRSRVAQLIYETDPAVEGPFIIFDPGKIPEFVFQTLGQLISTNFKTELGQIGALFGYADLDPAHAGTPWQGFLKLAQNGTLVINGIESLKPKVQRLLAQYMTRGIFYPVNYDRPANAKVRIIAIASDELGLSRDLYNCLRDTNIRIPSLRERKRDLREISQRMIEEIAIELGKTVNTIDQEAMNVIMAYDWPGNFRELEEVLRRGVNLSKGNVLSAEEIYVGQVPITGKSAYNLLKVPTIRHLFKSPFFPKAPQIMIAGLFLVIIVMGLWGSPSPDSNVTLLLVWANWEPLLIISCFLLARVWCSFCPVGFIGELFQKISFPRFKISAEYLNYGFALSAVGLAIIFWSQTALDMWMHPKETAGLLLAMLLSAIVFALLFEGRVWCRYICPLGQMTATFARTSIVEVRSNYNYCSHECKTYDCYTGNSEIPGCKLAKGPFSLETNQNCNLCGNCIKLCPHQSVRLNLRPPGWELLNARGADLALLLFVPLLWGTQIFRPLETTDIPAKFAALTGSMSFGYAILMGLCALFAYLIANFGRLALGDIKVADGTISSSVYILSMLPIIYANEIALRLVPLLNHAADFFVILGNQIGYEIPHIAFRLDMHSIQILQVFLIMVSLFVAMHVLEKYRKLAKEKTTLPKLFVYLPFFIITCLSILLY